MKLAPVLPDEAERIAELEALKILDTPREPRFDRLTSLAADVFDVPMAFVNLVASDRQWFKSTCGLDGISDTPRDVGFCSHAIHEREAMVVPDASQDLRFADNPFVTGDFHLRFYAGGADPRPEGQGGRDAVLGRYEAARVRRAPTRSAEEDGGDRRGRGEPLSGRRAPPRIARSSRRGRRLRGTQDR